MASTPSVARIGGRVKRLKLADWMASLDPPIKPADLARETGIEKSQISRWLTKGQTPGPESLEILRQFFKLDDVESLFRLPNEDWIFRLFRDVDAKEQKRLREIVELARKA